jgi:hypothetical protein
MSGQGVPRGCGLGVIVCLCLAAPFWAALGYLVVVR